MPEEVMKIHDDESDRNENLEDENPETDVTKVDSEFETKNSKSHESEASVKMEGRTELVRTINSENQIVESTVEITEISEEHTKQISEELVSHNTEGMVEEYIEEALNEESNLEISNVAIQSETSLTKDITFEQEFTECTIATQKETQFSAIDTVSEDSKMTNALSKQSISRQTMQEKFSETILEPYKSTYSPLLTMRRNQKNPFEEKTPELILIEKLLDVRDEPKVEGHEQVETNEINKDQTTGPTYAKVEPSNKPPPATLEKPIEPAKNLSTNPEKDTNFVSFRKSCCVIS